MYIKIRLVNSNLDTHFLRNSKLVFITKCNILYTTAISRNIYYCKSAQTKGFFCLNALADYVLVSKFTYIRVAYINYNRSFIPPSLTHGSPPSHFVSDQTESLVVFVNLCHKLRKNMTWCPHVLEISSGKLFSHLLMG